MAVSQGEKERMYWLDNTLKAQRTCIAHTTE